jgi:hypothetical protein
MRISCVEQYVVMTFQVTNIEKEILNPFIGKNFITKLSIQHIAMP